MFARVGGKSCRPDATLFAVTLTLALGAASLTAAPPPALAADRALWVSAGSGDAPPPPEGVYMQPRYRAFAAKVTERRNWPITKVQVRYRLDRDADFTVRRPHKPNRIDFIDDLSPRRGYFASVRERTGAGWSAWSETAGPFETGAGRLAGRPESLGQDGTFVQRSYDIKQPYMHLRDDSGLVRHLDGSDTPVKSTDEDGRLVQTSAFSISRDMDRLVYDEAGTGDSYLRYDDDNAVPLVERVATLNSGTCGSLLDVEVAMHSVVWQCGSTVRSLSISAGDSYPGKIVTESAKPIRGGLSLYNDQGVDIVLIDEQPDGADRALLSGARQ